MEPTLWVGETTRNVPAASVAGRAGEQVEQALPPGGAIRVLGAVLVGATLALGACGGSEGGPVGPEQPAASTPDTDAAVQPGVDAGANPGVDAAGDPDAAEAGDPTVREYKINQCISPENGRGIWSLVMDGAEIKIMGNEPNAYYAVAALPVLEDFDGGHFELRGEFPRARLFSFGIAEEDPGTDDTYADYVTDHEILPVPGSVNPYLPGANPAKTSGQRYVLKIDDRESCLAQRAAGGLTDTLCGAGAYAASAAQENHVLHRIYEGPDAPELPDIFYVYRTDRPVPQGPEICAHIDPTPTLLGFPAPMLKSASQGTDSVAETLANDLQEPPNHTPTPGVDWVYQLIDFSGWANHSGDYIYAVVDPFVAQYAVVSFRAPTATRYDQVIEPGPTQQVRYYSVCIMNRTNLLYTYACVRDQELTPDAAGRVHIVLSSKADKPAWIDACHQPWLAYPCNKPELWIRHLQADPLAFPQSHDHFAEDPRYQPQLDADAPENIDALREHMADYYPEVTYYTAAELAERFDCNR